MWKKSVAKVRGSLTVRIFLVTALILAAACAVTYGFLAWATPLSYVSVVSDELDEHTLKLIGRLEQSTREECGDILDRFVLQNGVSVLVYDENGEEVDLPTSISIAVGGTAESRGAARDSVVVMEEGAGGDSVIQSIFRSDVDVISVKSGPVSDTGFPFSFQEDPAVYFLRVVSTVATVNQATEAMSRVLPHLVIVVLAISLLGAVFYSRYITRPIVRLNCISREMAELDFTWTCGETRADEIGQLGRNLDTLSHRLSTALNELQQANDALRRDMDRERELEGQRIAFFSAASHELKTPITILKGQLSGMLAGVDVYLDRDKYLAKSLAAANRMEGLVQEILTVSRMERTDFSLKQGRVDLSALVEEQTAVLADLAEQRGQGLSVSLAPGLFVSGDPSLLGRAVANLLSNASLHSPREAQITVRLERGACGPALTVENTGASLPEHDLPHLFQAFYRVDASRNRATGGSGLGLYLVKMILDRHGAACRIENQPGGVRVTVTF